VAEGTREDECPNETNDAFHCDVAECGDGGEASRQGQAAEIGEFGEDTKGDEAYIQCETVLYVVDKSSICMPWF
jgi:hypothetical protein